MGQEQTKEVVTNNPKQGGGANTVIKATQPKIASSSAPLHPNRTGGGPVFEFYPPQAMPSAEQLTPQETSVLAQLGGSNRNHVYPSSFQGNILQGAKASGPPPYDVSQDRLFGGGCNSCSLYNNNNNDNPWLSSLPEQRTGGASKKSRSMKRSSKKKSSHKRKSSHKKSKSRSKSRSSSLARWLRDLSLGSHSTLRRLRLSKSSKASRRSKSKSSSKRRAGTILKK